MTAEKPTISYHASEERIERLTACLATLGMNEYVLSVKDNERNNNTTKFLTDTGIIIIRNSDNGNIVTGYMASVSQAAKMYKMAGFERMPNGMYKKVTSNKKKHKNQQPTKSAQEGQGNCMPVQDYILCTNGVCHFPCQHQVYRE